MAEISSRMVTRTVTRTITDEVVEREVTLTLSETEALALTALLGKVRNSTDPYSGIYQVLRSSVDYRKPIIEKLDLNYDVLTVKLVNNNG
jgi:hypothetical protein